MFVAIRFFSSNPILIYNSVNLFIKSICFFGLDALTFNFKTDASLFTGLILILLIYFCVSLLMLCIRKEYVLSSLNFFWKFFDFFNLNEKQFPLINWLNLNSWLISISNVLSFITFSFNKLYAKIDFSLASSLNLFSSIIFTLKSIPANCNELESNITSNGEFVYSSFVTIELCCL